jgi:CxxC-x17-CxxC domain-containing protein
MNEDYKNNSTSRPMVKGNWKCSECGAEITQLPFQPQEDRLGTLKCLDCHRASRSSSSPSSSRPPRQNRPMVEGSWTCSGCGKEITQLPFEPKGDRPILCNDCYRTSRPPRESKRW